MKFKFWTSLALLVPAAAYGWSVACSPPRPQENEPLDSGSGGGPTSVAPAPDVDTSVGGAASAVDCGSGPDDDLEFSKKNLLRSVAQCAELRYCEFEATALALAARADEYTDNPTTDEHDALKSAFVQSTTSWSRVELYAFGPGASSNQDMEQGQGLGDLIYSWPSVSRCRAEEQVFGQAYEEKGFDNLVAVPVNSRGLFAVEYLTFYEGTDNDCTQFSAVNVDDAWTNTSAEQLSELKHAYLDAVSRDVAGRAAQLRQAWDPDEGNFHDELVTASGYMDQHQALNTVAHSLTYIEKEVKDFKVGAPAGLIADAPLERPEFSFAGGGTELIEANLLGFRDLFMGCGQDGAGLGFEDWLRQAGHGALADDMQAGLDASFDKIEGFPPLSSATTAELEELHATLKLLTDPLKTEFFGQGSPLGLTLPRAVEGDTD